MADPELSLFSQLPPVLVVDDDEGILKAIARELRSVAVVETFSNPLHALEAFRKKDYSVILSDLKMPEMSGLALLEKCANEKPLCQRILLTAFSDLLSAEESANKAKLHRLLSKPWEQEELVAAVEFAQRQFEIGAENQLLRKLALTDALTEVANRRYFKDRLEAEFSRARRFKRPLTLIMIDIDDFKKFNDECGHQKGDEVLKNVAQCLDSNKRTMDTVARYGGEEFAIILPEISRAQGAEIAKRHLESVKKSTNINISLGVANYPDDTQDPYGLVNAADKALLKAKALGKFQVVSFTEV